MVFSALWCRDVLSRYCLITIWGNEMRELLRTPVLVLLMISILVTCVSLVGGLLSSLISLFTIALILGKEGMEPLLSKSVKLLLFFFVVVIVYSVFGYGKLNSKTLLTQFFAIIQILSAFLISNYVRTSINDSQVKFFLAVFIIAITYSVLTTTYIGHINPMAVREYGFGDVGEEDINEASFYHSLGMMSYSLAHAMSVVAMGLSSIVCFASNKLLRFFSLFLLFFIIRLLFLMTITTALLLTCIGVSLVFVTYLFKGRILISLPVVILIITIVFHTSLPASVLNFSQDNNEVISDKLVDVLSYIETGKGEEQSDTRLELYGNSLSTFLGNPILGCGKDNGSRTVIGEHSLLFDNLAYYGLFALLLFVAWWNEFKKTSELLSDGLKVSYYYSIIPVFGLVTLKGEAVCIWLPYMSLFFIQIVFYYLDLKHEVLIDDDLEEEE